MSAQQGLRLQEIIPRGKKTEFGDLYFISMEGNLRGKPRREVVCFHLLDSRDWGLGTWDLGMGTWDLGLGIGDWFHIISRSW